MKSHSGAHCCSCGHEQQRSERQQQRLRQRRKRRRGRRWPASPLIGLLALGSVRQRDDRRNSVYASQAPTLIIPLSNLGFQYTASLDVGSEQQLVVNSTTNTSTLVGRGVQRMTDMLVDTGTGYIAVRDCNATQPSWVVSGTTCFEANDSTESGERFFCGGIPHSAVNDLGTSAFEAEQSPLDAIPGMVIEFGSTAEDGPYHSSHVYEETVSLPGATNRSTNVSIAGILGTFNVSDASEELHYGYERAGGILGLARTTTCFGQVGSDTAFYEMLLSVAPPDQRWVALDLNAEDSSSSSSLALGGVDAAYSDTLQWGEDAHPTTSYRHSFSLYDLSLCGVDLFANVTVVWPAEVNTGAACITLPEEMFDALTSWAPVNRPCPVDEAGQTTCYVNSGLSAADLPWLTFGVSRTGEPLKVPLGALLRTNETDENGNFALCLRRGLSIYPDTPSRALPLFRYEPIRPRIVLGSMALRSLYTVLDWDTPRVGFANKETDAQSQASAEASCAAPVVCVGMQSYDLSTNECTRPACEKYYFYNLDEDSQSCELSQSLRFIVYTLVFVFSALELSSHFLKQNFMGMVLRQRRGRGSGNGDSLVPQWEQAVGGALNKGVTAMYRAWDWLTCRRCGHRRD